jgi:hypothetical protein
MSLKRFFSKIFFAPKRVTKVTLKRKLVRKEKKKKFVGIWYHLGQYLFKRFGRAVKKGKNFSAVDDSVSALEGAFLSKSLAKKGELESKELDKDKLEQDIGAGFINDSMEHIGGLLRRYEQFIRQDLFIFIREANALLHSWKELMVNLDQKDLSMNLEGVKELYSGSGELFNSLVANCQEYNSIIQDIKRSPDAGEKVIQVQRQLQRIRMSLEKGQKMVNLDNNKDYKHINNYLQKSQRAGLSL